MASSAKGDQLPVTAEDVTLSVAAAVAGERAALLKEVPLGGGAALVVREGVAGSSRSRIFGRVARARAISTSLCLP